MFESHPCYFLILNDLQKHIIWRCETGRFSSSNGPFQRAKRAVSQRQTIHIGIL